METDTNTNTSIYVLSLLSLAIIFLIVKGYTAQFSEKQYLLNVYMHVLLTIIVWAVGYLLIKKNSDKIEKIFGDACGWLQIMALIGILVLVFVSIYMVQKSETIAGRNLWWIAFIVSMGFIAYPIIARAEHRKVFWSTCITLIAILVSLSSLAYFDKTRRFLGWGEGLVMILLGLIIFEVIDLIVTQDFTLKSVMRRQKIYAWITIVLFSGFVLYDTQKLMEKAKEFMMKISSGQSINPNYPADSMNLFLDIVNLFSSISRVQ